MTNKSNLWQPSATIQVLQKRAAILSGIRVFFDQKKVMEVDTPSMSAATVTDVHLQAFETEFVGPGYAGGKSLFLQTSPEFAMKRLLAAGSGCIFQICKAFRNEEAGRHHNPEFTMLEWYRLGFDEHQLMDEVDELLQLTLHCESADKLSYQQAFIEATAVDPLVCKVSVLQDLADKAGYHRAQNEEDRDTLLQFLFSVVVEPTIGRVRPCFIHDFPASQAALAIIRDDSPDVAARFEVYYQGIELANGFYELTDTAEQRRRFDTDNIIRRNRGLPAQQVDENFLAALAAGLPECAGVALGIDRLIMLALGLDCIEDVIAFPLPRA